jgi:hypothetical protein
MTQPETIAQKVGRPPKFKTPLELPKVAPEAKEDGDDTDDQQTIAEKEIIKKLSQND